MDMFRLVPMCFEEPRSIKVLRGFFFLSWSGAILRQPVVYGGSYGGILLTELKQRVEPARQRAAASANRELVILYWQIGQDILDRQQRQGWGANSNGI